MSSFGTIVDRYAQLDLVGILESIPPEKVETALSKETLSTDDFMALLSPAATAYIEPMAQKAHRLTVQHFGRTIQLFIPLYISNHCTNDCLYCGFRCINAIPRRKLSLEEIESEARAISATGMQHLLLLTGEARTVTPLSYLEAAVEILKQYFASVAIEMFPMNEDEYRRLRSAGVDGLTIYQEVYDRRTYAQLHRAGRKTDYDYRLGAPERGAQAGLRLVNIGALLGLHAVRSEILLCGLHAHHLESRYLDTEFSISLPRLNPALGNFRTPHVADDTLFVQMLTALRCFLPRTGITVSTRERADMRDHLLPLGVTRYSAGSCTGVGGYHEQFQSDTPQFEITDQRSVDQVVSAIRDKGYQPIYKDWDRIQ